MFGFQLQTKMIQAESLVAQLAQYQFDTYLEDYYFRAGEAGCFGADALSLSAVLLDKSKTYKSFNRTHNKQTADYLKLWAKAGISTLMYAKTDTNTGLPNLWLQNDKGITEYVNLLTPYLSSMDLTEHAETMKYITSRTGTNFTIPQPIIDAIINSGKIKNPHTASSLAMAWVYVLENTLVMYDRIIYSKDGKTVTGTETCFLTRNLNIINTLAQQGRLAVPSETTDVAGALTKIVNKCAKDLYGDEKAPMGNVTKRALASGCVPCAKLVFDRTANNVEVFKLTVPPSGLDIARETARAIPVRFMYQYCEGLLNAMFKSGPVSISCRNPMGEDFSVISTPSTSTFRTVYSDCPADAVSIRSEMPIGYSLRQGRLILFNLESSILSSHGYARINPFDIIKIDKVEPGSINRIIHTLNPISINTYFLRAVSAAKPADLANMTNGIPSLKKALGDKTPTKELISDPLVLGKVSHVEIVSYMSKLDRNYRVAIESVGFRGTTNGMPLEGATDEEKIENLTSLLNNGIICIKYESSNGLTDIIATNVESELMKVWGNDYQLTKNESWKVRCAALRTRVLRDNLSKQAIGELVEKYAIPNLDITKLASSSMADIDAWINEAAATRKKYEPKPGCINVRCLNRQSSFFKTLKIADIKTVSKVK